MVRTSGGIRISAGKSSKKGGGGSSGGHRSTSTVSGKSSGKSSNRLPPIPHCDAPSWQKPITNFFNSDAGPSKLMNEEKNKNENWENGENAESSKKEAIIEHSVNSLVLKDVEKSDSDEPMEMEKKDEEEMDKENVNCNTSKE